MWWDGAAFFPYLRLPVCLTPSLVWAGRRQGKARHDGTSLLCCCCPALPCLLTAAAAAVTQVRQQSPVTPGVLLPACSPACLCPSWQSLCLNDLCSGWPWLTGGVLPPLTEGCPQLPNCTSRTTTNSRKTETCQKAVSPEGSPCVPEQGWRERYVKR